MKYIAKAWLYFTLVISHVCKLRLYKPRLRTRDLLCVAVKWKKCYGTPKNNDYVHKYSNASLVSGSYVKGNDGFTKCILIRSYYTEQYISDTAIAIQCDGLHNVTVILISFITVGKIDN